MWCLLTGLFLAPTAGQLFALQIDVSGNTDSAQLWKTTPTWAGLQYDKLGPRHSMTVKSTSSCIDSQNGVFYYVGGKNSDPEVNDYTLYGISTMTGKKVCQNVLPVPNRSIMVPGPMSWQLGCDNSGGVYMVGDWDPIWTTRVDLPPTNRSLIRYDASTGEVASVADVPVNPHEPFLFQHFPVSAMGIAVAPDAGLVSVYDDTLLVADIATGEWMLNVEMRSDVPMPCGQVYDSQLNRFFGTCSGWSRHAEMVPFSCWWTSTMEPQKLEQLADYSGCGAASVDVSSRVAFFTFEDKLSVVSLDTGKVVSQFKLRYNHLHHYQSSDSSSVLL